MRILLPDKVKTILSVLKEAGYEAYAVGGCVRDSILGRVPDDWDITTNADTGAVKSLFHRTVDTGIAHGTVTVMLKEEAFEVTTYRIDGEYEDMRHPKQVVFTTSLEEDLKRRDFTINAMAYNDEDGLVDLFGGVQDLENRIIRCVGDPKERFGEDALRMLRAVRFSAQLSFDIEEKTAEAIRALSGNLSRISEERIMTELTKMLISPHPEYLEKAWELGMTKVFLPEFDLCMDTPQANIHHAYSVGGHILKTMENIEPDRILRFTMLLHDIAKPLVKTTDEEGVDHFRGHQDKGAEVAEEVLKRLKCDNDTIRKVCELVRCHDERTLPEKTKVRRLLSRLGEEQFGRLLKVQTADTLGQSMYQREEKLARVAAVGMLATEILAENDCISLKDLAITGRDVIEAGIPKGPEVGRILAAALDEVLAEPARNDRAYLLKRIKEY